jgi:hypothetical protein
MKRITTTITIFCSLAAIVLPSCKKECTSGQNFVVQASMRVEPQTTEIRLGDTLTVTIEVPYNNVDLHKNVPLNIAGYNVSEFGLEAIVANAVDNKLVGEGLDQFTLIPQKGGGDWSILGCGIVLLRRPIDIFTKQSWYPSKKAW